MKGERKKLILVLKKILEKKNTYSSYQKAREWIEGLIQLDLVGKPYPATKYSVNTIDQQAVDVILREWLRIYPEIHFIDKEKRDFIAKVFAKKRSVIFDDDWLKYISAICQYFRASSKTDVKANLSLFMLGVAWITTSYEDEGEE